MIFLDCGRSLSNLRFLWESVCLYSFPGIAGGLAADHCTFPLHRSPPLESYEKQKRFITDAGHEIKTPLTIIDADASVLAMDLGENEWIADIQEQSAVWLALTNDLILLSRLEEDNTQMQLLDFPSRMWRKRLPIRLGPPCHYTEKRIFCFHSAHADIVRRRKDDSPAF